LRQNDPPLWQQIVNFPQFFEYQSKPTCILKTNYECNLYPFKKDLKNKSPN
jgi:hypothetical protein